MIPKEICRDQPEPNACCYNVTGKQAVHSSHHWLVQVKDWTNSSMLPASCMLLALI